MMHLPVPARRPLVVFTDLDGTLIDHHTYGIEGSREAMRKLAGRNAPLVFCSSKTFAEQVHLQRALGIFQPFIFENGSAAAVPRGFFPEKMYAATRREAGTTSLFSRMPMPWPCVRFWRN
ncbi:MAG: HAD hydrolase family protein [Lewinellaceae bacterium]|nr:HAD hydrolase family protein [Lewinellaceae bacterium]